MAVPREEPTGWFLNVWHLRAVINLNLFSHLVFVFRSFALLGLAHVLVLVPWASPGIDDVSPVLCGSLGQVAEPLDQEHAGVADDPGALLLEEETLLEKVLVLGAVGEPGAAGLGLADAAARGGPEGPGPVEREHPPVRVGYPLILLSVDPPGTGKRGL